MVTRQQPPPQQPRAPSRQPAARPQQPAAPPPRIRPRPKKKVMGEEALKEFGSARKSTHYIMRYVIVIALLIAGIYTMLSGTFSFLDFLFPGMYVSLALMIIAGAFLLWSEMDLMYTDYAVTPTRVVENVGILKKKTVAVNINMITGTRVHQSLLDRIFGVGNLEINTHYKEHALTLRNINDPAEMEAYILQLQSGRQQPPPQAPPPAPAAPPAQPPQRQPGY